MEPEMIIATHREQLLQEMSGEGASTPLCRRCAEIDIDALIYGKEVSQSHPRETVGPGRKAYLSLGPASPDAFVPWCGLCQFFIAVSPTPDLGPRVPNQELVIRDAPEESFGQVYSEGRLIPYPLGQFFVARECVTVSGTFHSLGNAFCTVDSFGLSNFTADGLAKGRIIEPDCIDYSVIRTWIGHCKESHTECLSPSFMPLKVIDCKQRILIKVQGHVAYAALSYVWGASATSEEEPPAADRLPIKLPATVEDAIKVTLGLGYSYLWVDRYCISQHGGEEKAQEIARMDEIYQGAEIVIIDAAGDDPALGLPGVSRQRSVTQPRFAASTYTLVSLMSYPLNQILASRWATRGWTYQEGVLAKRRLFFTNEQVYFECDVYGCLETLCQPLIHPPRGVPSIKHTNVIPDIKRSGTIIISDYLGEYNKRQLSYSSDALNAFRGVFHMFERQSPPLLHCGGVPLLNNDFDDQVSTSVTDLLGFLRGLCWIAPWEDTVRRRPGFPSWSWTGWQCPGGGIGFHELNFPIYCSLSWFYTDCDDRTVEDPIEYGCETDVIKQYRADKVRFSILPSPGALYMKGSVVTFRYLGQNPGESFCSGSATRNIWFEHRNRSSREIGKCVKPVITRFHSAGIPKGPQSLSAIKVAQSIDPNLINGSSASQTSTNGHQKGNKGPGSFIPVFLLLNEIQDTSSAFPPYKAFERVGLVVLDFPTVQHFQMSDWFLEAVEQDVIIF
ncbi:HET-domain-containing protein [Xylaria curta]|nr:HET-domain-containing protein [Xylaria curta]